MPIVDIADPTCPLPDVLIFDASVLLELSPEGAGRRQQAVHQFLSRVSTEAISGRLLCIAPVITFEECYFKLIQQRYFSDLPAYETRLKKTLKRRKVSWHHLYKDSPQLIQNYMPMLRRFRTAVLNIPIIPIEPEDMGNPPPALEQSMFEYIEQVPILPKDAYLLAIAKRLDIPHIATLDADFRAATNWLHVYTVV